MRIVKIHINEFGPLVNKDFEFDENLTLVRGDNESGKSSLMLFIKFMLYGLSKKARAGSGTVAETERALTHTSNVASGYMTLKKDGTLYRIDRFARRSGKTVPEKVQLIEAESGKVCIYSGSVGEFLLGIPAEIFESSSSISQLGCATVGGKEIGTAIKNLLSSADESIDSKKALLSLENIRKRLLHKNAKGGSIFTLGEKKNELSARFREAVENSCETERIRAELEKTETKLEEVMAKQRSADELVSRIGLCSVVAQFDKLHELETERDETERKLDEIKQKTVRGELTLDRSTAATLNSISNEITFAENELSQAEQMLRAARAEENTEELALLETVDREGGVDHLESFFEKSLRTVKSKSTSAALFALAALIVAPTGFFLKLSFLPFSALLLSLPVSLLLLAVAVLSLLSRSKAKSALRSCCERLGTSEGAVSLFLTRVKKALSRKEKNDELCRELITAKGIKEKILCGAAERARKFFELYGIGIPEATSISSAAKKEAADILALCDEQDILLGRLNMLDANVKELSSELSDYNEHQLRRRISKDILEMSEDEIRTAKTNKEFFTNQLKALGDKKLSYERALISHKFTTEDPFDISAKINETGQKLEAQKMAHSVISLAEEAITTASANLRSTIAPQIRALANNYMNDITDGKYYNVTVSDTLELSMSDEGFMFGIDSFSTGTKDAAYLALRLSLLSLVGKEEMPPLLMDETLAMIDDKRARKLLSMLSHHASENGQCILFSCNDREERLCRAENIPFSVIEM